MKRSVAFLRGINVGGIRVAMPELQRAFERLGCQNVKTFLNTGNVAFDSTESLTALKGLLEAELSRTFGYDAYVLLYESSSLRPVVEGYPFSRDEEYHAYVVFIASEPVFEELKTVAAASGEPTASGPSVLYWKVKRGESTETPLAKILAKAKYKASTTIRNLNTLEKMLGE